MSTREHLQSVVASVVASVQPVVTGVCEDAMGSPTPCPDFAVRSVAHHLLGTAEAIRRVGASEPMDPEDPWGTHGDYVGERWREDLNQRLDDEEPFARVLGKAGRDAEWSAT